jgi:hypothetical protein
MLLAGEATTDITPPVGAVLAGFHYAPGSERRATAARMPSQARALYLKLGADHAVMLSIDVIGLSRAFCERMQREISAAIDVPRRAYLPHRDPHPQRALARAPPAMGRGLPGL